MRFLPTRNFFKALRLAYPGPTEGYFWDALSELPHFVIGERVSRRRINVAALELIRMRRAKPPFYIFTDCLAGWRGVAERRRKAPAEFASVAEALDAITNHSHFRGGTSYADNYYLTDAEFSWFIVFCHHNDVHVMLHERAVKAKEFTLWAQRSGAKRHLT